MSVCNSLTNMIFETIGLRHKNPQTDEEKELCDISFPRYIDTIVMERFNIIKVTTGIGGRNRLDYKKNIREIRSHPLYIDDCDYPKDGIYTWWYLRVPESKKNALRALFPSNYTPLNLNRDFYTEEKVWNKLNNPHYIDLESDTEYSDEEDFYSRYGYWYADDTRPETSDEMEDADDENESESSEVSDSISSKIKYMEI